MAIGLLLKVLGEAGPSPLLQALESVRAGIGLRSQAVWSGATGASGSDKVLGEAGWRAEPTVTSAGERQGSVDLWRFGAKRQTFSSFVQQTGYRAGLRCYRRMRIWA